AVTEDGFAAIQVALWVPHDAGRPVGADVTAVAEFRRLDDVDSHATSRGPARARARIDPAIPAAWSLTSGMAVVSHSSPRRSCPSVHAGSSPADTRRPSGEVGKAGPR